MQRPILLSTLVLAACNSTGPEKPDWIVRGTVTAVGQPVSSATVSVTSLPSLLGIPQAGGTTSRPDGTFEIHVRGTCAYSFLSAAHPLYQLVRVDNFDREACPRTLSSVRVIMAPYPTLTVTTADLPNGALGIHYDEALLAIGGDSSYYWSIVQGALPPGLELLWDRVSGTPTAAGTWTFTVRVDSGDEQVDERELTLVIVGGPIVAPDESCSSYPDSAVVTFEDPLLQKAVRLSLAVGNDVLLTCELVASLSVLNASDSVTQDGNYNTVVSVAGLQNLTGLVELDLGGNRRLSDVGPLAGLTGLTSLSLRIASVSDVSPLSGLTNLEALDLSGNGVLAVPLSDIGPLGSLTALVALDLRGNAISDLGPLSGMSALTRLDAGINRVADIGALAGAVRLRYVDLEFNQISDLGSLAGMADLEYLDVGSNRVSSLAPLAGKTKLAELRARNPGTVTDVAPLAGLESLKHLDLLGSDLSDTTPLSGLPLLETLRLDQGHVPTLALADLPNLQWVDASQSSVAVVSLTGVPGLLDLNLGLNEIEDVSGLASLDGVWQLSLSNNAIRDIGPLGSLTSVVRLGLHHNDITDVSALEGLPNLQFLALSENEDLADVQPLIGNPGLGAGDVVDLSATAVPCSAVGALRAKGVEVYAYCP